MELSNKEKLFLDRLAKRRNLYLLFSLLSAGIAAFLLVYHGLIQQDLNGLRFVIILLLSLAGRAHLRQYRSAVIFHKLILRSFPLTLMAGIYEGPFSINN